MMTFPAHGHYMTLRDVGVALKRRGHDVTFVLCEGNRGVFEADGLRAQGIRFLSAGACPLYYREHDDVMRRLLAGGGDDPAAAMAMLDGVAEMNHEMCQAVMPLYGAAATAAPAGADAHAPSASGAQQQSLLPDVLVFDADTFCAQDLSMRFRIPRVARVGTGPRDAYTTPVSIPQFGGARRWRMGFLERLANAASLALTRTVISPLILRGLAAKHRFAREYAEVRPTAAHVAAVAAVLGAPAPGAGAEAWADLAAAAAGNGTDASAADCTVAADGAPSCAGAASAPALPPPALPPTTFHLDGFSADVPWDGAPVLYNSHWGLEYPRRLHPFEHMIGHTTDFAAEAAREMPPAVAAWLALGHSAAASPSSAAAAAAGAPPVPVVYVGLGTLSILPPDELRALAATMRASACCRFLWAVPAAQQHLLPEDVRSYSDAWYAGRWQETGAAAGDAAPPGTLLLAHWLPQVAVLTAKPGPAVFWTHGGMNGVAEGTFARAPMLCMPLFSDQPDNCQRLQDRSMGLRVPRVRSAADAAAVAAGLQRLLSRLPAHVAAVDAAWRANLAAGGILRAVQLVEAAAALGYEGSRTPFVPRELQRPLAPGEGWPGSRASQHGGGAAGEDGEPAFMPWYEKHDLDVAAAALALGALLMWAAAGCARCCRRRCCPCCRSRASAAVSASVAVPAK